ncbi:unnamed protein product [Brachionus calyciflorus]|uniref:BRCA1-associated protein n=1 Tax=Brachionus calyciflorus TaxID=104777 RepID=A0A814AC52_9BILA|nr:unnamed protein product [Brachionus calyciflorus]
MKDEVISKSSDNHYSTIRINQQTKHVSLVIIRLEIDDITQDNKFDIEQNNLKITPSSDIKDIFKYNSPSSLQKINFKKSLDSTHTELKPEILQQYIGKRQSRSLRIETFENFDKMFNSQDSLNHLDCETNSMTMQTALETAYSDWNREKINHNISEPEQSVESKTDSIGSVLISENNDLNSETKKPTIVQEDIKTVNSKKEENKTTEISFYYGNPTIDIVKGFIHIYKDKDLTPLEVSESSKIPISSSLTNSSPIFRSELLCMIGIPANINCNELLEFLMPFSESIVNMRIIRDAFPNQYMTLVKFKSQSDADEFYLHNNNRRFNSIEETVCRLVYVEKIEAINSSKGASLPIPGFIELPDCSICLEKMDEPLNGIITILCNHSFHANCLSKWGDTCCPVCRFNQTPDYTMENTCNECGSHDKLWICLICGHIGCGRYVRGHAYQHFQLTNHNYSMLLGCNKVWDYAADNYVHRLIQNKTDGKLVQLDENGRAVQQDEKMDSITLEYTYLLTSQLESQRAYYEEKISRIEEKCELQLTDLEDKSKQSEFENSKLKENLFQLTKEKNALEKKCSTLNTKLTKLQSEFNEEKEMNKCLSSNQEIYQSKLSKMEENLKKLTIEKDAEIQELKSQLRDIMFYLDAQNKISENVSKEELDQSHVIIQQDEAAAAATNSSPSTKSNNRRRKK